MKGNVICVLMVAMRFLEVEIAAVPLVDVDIWADSVISEEKKNITRFFSEKDSNRLPRGRIIFVTSAGSYTFPHRRSINTY